MLEKKKNWKKKKLVEFCDRVMAVYYRISIQFESGSQ
jgi:hypothetical protein